MDDRKRSKQECRLLQIEIQQIRDHRRKEKVYKISRRWHGRKSRKKLDEDKMEKLDTEVITTKEALDLRKEQREIQQKLKSREKKGDHLERAKRIGEIFILEEAFEEKEKQAKQWWDQNEWQKVLAAIKERHEAVATRNRMVKMKDAHDEFLAKMLAERNSIYLEKLHNFEKMLNEERTKRLSERKIQRKAERKASWERDRAERAKCKQLEESRIAQEEEKKSCNKKRATKSKEQAKAVQRFVKRKKAVKTVRRHDSNIERPFEEQCLKEQQAPQPWQSPQGSYPPGTGPTRNSHISDVGSSRNTLRESPRDDESKENSNDRFKRNENPFKSNNRANTNDNGRTNRRFNPPQQGSRLRMERGERGGRDPGRDDRFKDDKGRNNYDMPCVRCLDTGTPWHDTCNTRRPPTIRQTDERIKRPPRTDLKLDDSSFQSCTESVSNWH